MINGIQDVYIYVQEMARAAYFYREVLGLELTDEDEHFTGLTAGGVRVGLHWTGGSPIPAAPSKEHGPLAGVTLTFRVENMAMACSRLEAKGSAILGEADQPWGSCSSFKIRMAMYQS